MIVFHDLENGTKSLKASRNFLDYVFVLSSVILFLIFEV